MSMLLLAACGHAGPGSPQAATAPQPAPEAAASAGAAAGDAHALPEREAVDPAYRWKVEDLFADAAAWRSSLDATVARFPELAASRGKLGEVAGLQACLDTSFEIARALHRVHSYANRVADQDTRRSAGAAMKGEVQKVLSEFGEITAFIEPELLALSPERFGALKAAPALATYAHFLDAVERKRAHTLGPAEEALLAQASLLARAPENVYDIFTGSDLKFGPMTDSAGQELTISIPVYMRYRAADNREDRRRVFEGFWSVYRAHQNTFATLLASQLNSDVFFSKARRYGSSLEAALDSEPIPPEVYTTMVKAVNEHLPLLHRYLRLRKKLLGVDQLHYYDMYPPLIPAVSMRYTYEEGVAEVSAAVAPLGEDYRSAVTEGMGPGKGWVDVRPTLGKRTGAYMSGEAYDVHPFVLLNYQGSYDDVSTLAHEMGHAMHSYLTHKTQPFHYSDYSTFIAEIASTFNESLLMHHMLGKTTERDRRLYLLGEYMETFRTVVFRQALFAEFELEAHRLTEQGKVPTAEDFNRIYRGLLERYYGAAEGVTTIEERDEVEWAYIPHFYYNYYVYSYVTGFIAATALATRVIEQGQPAVEPYLQMLARGSSNYPATLLKDAGVDMTQTAPYAVAMKRFAAVLDEVEALLEAKE